MNVPNAEPVRIFLDVAIKDKKIGRLLFHIPYPTLLPLHTENLIKLCSKERISIDPKCTYVGCEFQYSPQSIEGFPQYRWTHTLKGNGRNAIGRPEERISDSESLRQCAHSIYGGTYYGIFYDSILDKDENATLLTVPFSGPGRGYTSLSIVRVAESPQEWKERLLINSITLGWMDPSSADVLLEMARQTLAPPVVINSGIV